MTDNLQLINFKSEHAHRMVNSIMNDPHTEWDSKYQDQLNGLEVPNMSFTALKNNEIVCAGGVIPIWDNVFEGWVMATNLVWQYRIGSAKLIKQGMDELVKKNKIIRLQTAVKKDFFLGQRFAEWLGIMLSKMLVHKWHT
jgi:hypothetical protein